MRALEWETHATQMPREPGIECGRIGGRSEDAQGIGRSNQGICECPLCADGQETRAQQMEDVGVVQEQDCFNLCRRAAR